MNIEFRNYDKNNDLDYFNLVLARASNDRFELREAVNGVKYLYDYDTPGVVRNKVEILDILENQYLEDFIFEKDFIKKLLKTNIITRIIGGFKNENK